VAPAPEEPAAAELHQQAADHRRLQAFFDHALDGILITNDAAECVDANLAACEILGYAREELLGRPLWHFTPDTVVPTARATWAELLEMGALRGTFDIQRGDGAVRELSFSARASVLPGLHMSIIRDVTDQRRLEMQLRGAQRMEAVGRLAGGIAHDFNNLLTVILGFTAEVLETHPNDPDLQFLLGEVKRAGERAADMTRKLLAFSRRQTVRPRRFDINGTVQSMTAMLQRLIGEDVHFEMRVAPEPVFVESDPGQLEQVLTNLVVNARDAMPRGGRLTITTGTRTNPQSSSVVIPSGEYAELCVSDTGEGIAPEHLSSIFEPFFTTKASGKGTGLGLATVYGIIKQAGGFITVDSVRGKGSTFRVLLPLKPVVATEEPVREGVPIDYSMKGKSVLLVEDEPQVRHVAERFLARAGLRTVSTESPEEALTLLEKAEPPFDVVLSDVVMPRMSGLQLAERARTVAPGVPFVFMSGYSTDHAMLGEWRRNEQLVAKPLEMTSLLSALARAMDDRLRNRKS
jgi:PAS domain S-box-containing protein